VQKLLQTSDAPRREQWMLVRFALTLNPELRRYEGVDDIAELKTS
jgi:hypothetical protein